MTKWHIISEEHYRLLGGGMFEPDEIVGDVPGPCLLVTEGNGIAVAVTKDDLFAAMTKTATNDPHQDWPADIITALTRPADGAAK